MANTQTNRVLKDSLISAHENEDIDEDDMPAQIETRAPVEPNTYQPKSRLKKGLAALKTVYVMPNGKKLRKSFEGQVNFSDPKERDRSLAKEIYRRAQYQLLSPEERSEWLSSKGAGGDYPAVSAKTMRFDGMSEGELLNASPSDIIERFLASVAKKRGKDRSEYLRLLVSEVEQEYTEKRDVKKQVVKVQSSQSSATNSLGHGSNEITSATPAPALPLPGPQESGRDVAARMKAVGKLAATVSGAIASNPTVDLSRLGPKSVVTDSKPDLGKPLPMNGQAAVSDIPPPGIEQPKDGKKPAKAAKPTAKTTRRAKSDAEAQIKEAADAQLKQSRRGVIPEDISRLNQDVNKHIQENSDDAVELKKELTVGSYGRRVVRVRPAG